MKRRLLNWKTGGVLLLLLLLLLLLPLTEDKKADAGEETVTITVWTKNRHDLKFQQEKIDEYNATNQDHIFVKYKVYSNNYTQAVSNAIMNKNAPDLMTYADDIFYQYVDQRKFENLIPYMDEEFLELFEKVMVEGMNVENGRCYYVPTGISNCRLIYNKDIFARAGIDAPPETMEEMIEDARLITEKFSSEGIYGFAINLKEAESALDRSFMPEALTETGLKDGYDFAEGAYDFSEYQDTVAIWRELLSKKCAYPKCQNLSMDPLREMFADGKIGMYFTYAFSEKGVYSDLFPMTEVWESAGMPVLNEKKCAAGKYNLNGGYLLNADSEHPEEAWKVYTAVFANKENLTEYHMAGLSVSAIDQVIEEAEARGYQTEAVYLPDEEERIWPKAPHERENLHIEGNEWADTIKNLLLNETEIEPELEKLSNRYNTAYREAVQYGLCEEIRFAKFNPREPLSVCE